MDVARHQKFVYRPDGEKANEIKRFITDAHADYDSRATFRAQRHRALDFVRGDQWKDEIYDHRYGDEVSEQTYLERRGRLTTKNNMLGPIVRNLIGQFRDSKPDPLAIARNKEDAHVADVMNTAVRAALDINQADKMDAHAIREIIISGATGQRVEFSWWEELGRDELELEPIQQNRWAYNNDMQSPTYKDLTRWVYLHDMSLDEVIATYAKSKAHAKKITDFYAGRKDHNSYNTVSGKYINRAVDFYTPYDINKCRVIEIWRKKYDWHTYIHDQKTGVTDFTDMSEAEVAALNGERLNHAVALEVAATQAASGEEVTQAEMNEIRQRMIDNEEVPLFEMTEEMTGVWYCYHVTPNGDVLFESITPYWHKTTPIVFELYPFVEGDVYGLVTELIDQQKYINRSISMLDFFIGASAKGVMMIDKNSIPKEYQGDIEQYEQDLIEYDGRIYYESDDQRNVNLPKYITNNSVPVSLPNMLQIQTDLLEKISGVTGPVAGHNPQSGTPASLYAQQTANASLTNRDMFETFFHFLKRRNLKCIKLIQQYWDEVIQLRAGGRNNPGGVMRYVPDEIRGVEYDIVMAEGMQSAAYRQYVDHYLNEFLVNQFITFEEYLEESPMPYANTLLEKVRQRKQQMQEQQQAMAQQGFNPQEGGGDDPLMEQQLGTME